MNNKTSQKMNALSQYLFINSKKFTYEAMMISNIYKNIKALSC